MTPEPPLAGGRTEADPHPAEDPGRRYRIVFVTQVDPSGRSGQNVATKEVASALAAAPEIELCIICPYPAEGVPPELGATDCFRFLPQKRAGSWGWHVRSQWSMLRHLRGSLRVRRADAIVARLGPSLLVPPYLARRFGVPFILLIRGVPRSGSGRLQRWLRAVLPGEFVARYSVRKAHTVFVAFQEVEERARRLAGSASVEVQVFPNAVNPELFPPSSVAAARRRVGLRLEGAGFVLGFVGSLRQRHGLFELFEAAGELVAGGMDLHLLIVGEGPLRKELEETAHHHQIRDRVRFTGHVSHHLVAPYISACDALYGVVHPHLPSNPIKCQEYLACGRPILTSRRPELRFVEEVEAGIAIEDLTPESVAGAIRSLAAVSEDDRQAMGRRGREYVLQHHTWSRLVDLIRVRLGG